MAARTRTNLWKLVEGLQRRLEAKGLEAGAADWIINQGIEIWVIPERPIDRAAAAWLPAALVGKA